MGYYLIYSYLIYININLIIMQFLNRPAIPDQRQEWNKARLYDMAVIGL